MADNLVVGLVLDASKFRLGLETVTRETKAFAAEMRKALDAGDARRAEEFSQKAESAGAAARALGARLREARKAADEARGDREHGIMGLSERFDEFGRRVLEFTKIGVGIEAVRKIGEALKSGLESLAGLKEQSEGLGLSPQFVQVYRQVFAQAGVAADGADRSISRVVKSLGEARLELYKTGQLTLQTTKVMRGGAETGIVPQVQVLRGAEDGLKGINTQLQTGIAVFHGATQAAVDYTDVWKAFGVDIRKFGADEKGAEGAIAALVKGFDAFSKRDPVVAGTLASQFLGKDWPAQISALREFAKLAPEIKAAMAGQLGFNIISPEKIAQAHEANVALTQMSQSFKDLRDRATAQFAPALANAFTYIRNGIQNNSAFIDDQLAKMGKDVDEFVGSVQAAYHAIADDEFLAEQIGEIKAMFASFGEWFRNDLTPNLQAAFKSMWDAATAGATAAYSYIVGVWSQLPEFFAGIWNSVKSVVSAIGDAVSKATSIGTTPAGFATGGQVYGSGSGDSVPAVLTPGEFVNRVASVRYYGADLFRALNARAIPRGMMPGYAMGGLVDSLHAPVRGFADGGMVPSGGGTPVHLHLDGREFVTHADDGVARSLVSVSQRYQMRSAGVKPSWYGGRPGG